MLEAQPSSTLRLLAASSARKGRWVRHHQMEETLPKKNWSKNGVKDELKNGISWKTASRALFWEFSFLLSFLTSFWLCFSGKNKMKNKMKNNRKMLLWTTLMTWTGLINTLEIGPLSFFLAMFKQPAPNLQQSHTMSEYAHLSLSTLPPDVLLQIQTFLDPDDIISLHKVLILLCSECLILTVFLSFLFETSKVLGTVTKWQIVWINALHQVWLMHGINFSMFYPLENILQIELEHATFSKYAKDNIPSKGDIKPIVTRILEPQLPPVLSMDENIPFTCDALLLILGGQFLFTNMILHGVSL